MVVQSLSHEHLSQIALLPGVLFQLGPLVLEPYLDLVFVETELLRQVSPPLLRQVPVLVKLPLKSVELVGAEGRPWTLLG